MENASKALIMAGSVLIAILVIGMLVLGYRNLSSLEQQKEDSESDSTLNYMVRFEQFNRTLYGSELLSLANLQEDYNSSYDVNYEGYDRIEITVVTKGIVNSSYFMQGTYNLDAIAEDQNKIETAISQYEKTKKEYNNKSVKYYSSKRNREIASDFDISIPSSVPDYDIESYLKANSTTAKLLEEIQEYKNLTTIYNEFRTGKKFKCTNVIYNNQNGRISSMYFEEI